MKKILFPLTFLFLAILSFNFISLQYHVRSSGSPGGNTGAPGEFNGRTCANVACHSGGDTFRAGMISSNIPAGGYVPGETYTITGTVSEPGRIKFGFEISPQDSLGNFIGTLIRTNTMETKFTNGNRSLTHTSNGNAGPGEMRSWSFDWTAPPKGTGGFSFWGAFNAANNNGNNDGDIILRSNLRIEEDLTVSGIGGLDPRKVFIGPNPARDLLRISLSESFNERLLYQFVDQDGRVVLSGKIKKGWTTGSLNLEGIKPGNYILRINSRSESFSLRKRIIKM